MVKAHTRIKILAAAFALLAAPVCAETSAPDSRELCLGPDAGQKIAACTDYLLQPGLSIDDATMAYAMRALAYSLRQQYDLALPDYDKAIRLNPAFAVALNNRAWALYKMGRAGDGMDDIERSLSLSPLSPHAIDTRAHIHQSLGEVAPALADYDRVMRLGGEPAVKLYQCGLQSAGLYKGEIDGHDTPELRAALDRCVEKRDCDPLPPDEECRKVTS